MPGEEKNSRITAVVSEALFRERVGLYQFIRARVPAEEVDDIVQQAAVRAIERAVSLKDPQKVVPWLYRIYRNVLIDAARKRTSEGRVIQRTSEVPENVQPEIEDWCGCSVNQIGAINASYGKILKLVDINGVSVSEVARLLNISVSNASVRLHRARAALRKQMLEHCGVSTLKECLSCRCIDDGCCPV